LKSVDKKVVMREMKKFSTFFILKTME